MSGQLALLGYKVDTTGLVKARTEIVSLKKEARLASDQLMRIGGNGATGKVLRSISSESSATGKALGRLRAANDSASISFKKTTKASGAADTAMQKLGASFDQVQREAAEAGRDILELGSKTGRAVKSFDNAALASVRLRDANGRLRETNDRYVLGADKATTATGRFAAGFSRLKIAIGIGVAALAGMTRGAFGIGVSFEESMNTVQSKLLITTEAMTDLRDQAKELGATTQFSASQAADGMGFLAQAGLDASQIMAAMPDVLNLAAGASLTLAESADIATNVMGGFGLEVDSLPMIMDVLAASSAKTNTSVAELAQAFVKTAPVASEFGVSVMDTAASVGILADSGIKGERAGTVLLNMFTRLVNPVGEGKKALDAMNISQADLFTTMDDGKTAFIGMGAMMDLLAERGVDTTKALEIFGQEAGPGMLKILEQGSGGFQEYANKIDIAGAAAKQAEIKMQGLPGVVKSAASAWEALNIAFIELGGSTLAITVLEAATDAMRATVKGANDLANSWSELTVYLSSSDDTAARLFRAISEELNGIGKSIAPVLPYLGQFVAVAGGIALAVNGVAAIGVAFGAVGAAISAMGAALLANPITLTVAAIGAAAYLIYDNWDGIEKWWGDMWSSVADAAGTALDFFENQFPLVFGLMETQVKATGKVLEGDFAGAWDVIVSGAEDFGGNLLSVFTGLGQFLYEIGGEIIEWFADGIVDGYNDVKKAITGAIDTVAETVKGSATSLIEAGRDTVDGFVVGMGDKAGDVAEAAEETAAGAVDSLKNFLGIQSPSRLMIEMGRYVSEGFALGIESSAGLVSSAVEKLSKEGVEAFDRIKDGLDREILALTQGQEALERYDLTQKGVIGTHQDAIVSLRDKRDALAKERQVTEQIADEMARLGQAQHLQNIELTQGADAAAVAALELDGYSTAQAENAVQTQNNMRFQQAFSDTLGNLFDAVLNGQNPLKEMENIGKSWLRDMISTFATNKITAYFTGEGASGVSGMFDSVLGSMKNMFGGGASSSGVLSNALGGLKDMFSGTTSVSDTLGNAVGGLKSIFTGAGAAASVNTAAIGATSQAYGAATIASHNAAAGMAAAAGPILAIAAAAVVFRSALSGTSQQVAEGFRVGFAEGSVVGDNVAFWEKEKSFWRGTKMWEEYSELSAELADKVGEYMSNMHTSVVSTASALGVDGASMIMDNYQLAVKTFRGENAEAELAEYLKTSTSEAYKLAYDELAPELQSLVLESTGAIERPVRAHVDALVYEGDRYGRENDRYIAAAAAHGAAQKKANDDYTLAVADYEGNLEDMQGILEEMALAAVVAGPAVEALGLSIEGTASEIIAHTMSMSEAFGGVAPMMERLTLYANEFTPAADTVSGNLQIARQQLDVFSEGIGLNTVAAGNAQVMIGDLRAALDLTTPAGQAANEELNALAVTFGVASDGVIDTRAELVAYVDELKRQEEAGSLTTAQLGAMTEAALSNMEAIIQVENAMIEQKLTLDTVSEAARMLNLNFDASAPSANAFSNELVNLMGGLDQFTQATNHYFQEYFTLEEQQDFALAKTAEAVHVFNSSLTAADLAAAGVTDSVIDTEAELRRYIETLDATDPANAQAIATAIGVSEAMSALDETGQGLESTIDGLPANLTASFDTMTAEGDNTANSMVENAGTIEGARIITESSFGQLANAMTFLANSSAAAAGVAGGAAQAAASQSTAAYNQAIGAGASHSDAIQSANASYSEYLSSAESAQASASAANASRYQAGQSAAEASRAAESARQAEAMRRHHEQADGSHATGLYSVPFDGYRAVVHKDEMIPNADVSNQLRALGVTEKSVPDWLGSATPVNNSISTTTPRAAPATTPIVSQPARNDNAELLARIDEMVRKQAETNAELAEIKASARRREGTQSYTADKQAEGVAVQREAIEANEQALRRNSRTNKAAA